MKRPYLICVVLSCCFVLMIHQIAIAVPALEQAQNLNNQGKQQLEQGKPDRALQLWQQSEALYQQSGDTIGVFGTRLNQAKALQALGLYRRSQELLIAIEQSLRSQSDSALKANTLLTLGNGFRLLGNLERSQQSLQESYDIAKRLRSLPDLQAAVFHLGNTFTVQKQYKSAQSAYQEAIQIPGSLKVTAQIQLVKLLLKTQQNASTLINSIQLKDATTYEKIEFARLIKNSEPKKAAQLLARSSQEAQQMNNDRAASFAIGELGHLYEHTQQWQEAQQLTQKALNIAKSVQIPELSYQWEWQLGRILVAKKELQAASQSYIQAITTLQSLRQDLIAIDQDIQFSFREQVEPVYREFVDLLLRGTVSQDTLKQARQTIEALQLAELNNFFREACLDTVPRAVDEMDQKAAVIYPIILPDRLEIIVSLHNQPLQRYTTVVPQAQVETVINQMVQSMRVTSFPQERFAVAQQLYQWLVQPAIASLQQQSIKTLVFVMDGELRRIPIAALHNGQNYLIEQYAIAVTPSLRLFRSGAIASKQPRAIIAGLSEATQGIDPLPGVQQEIEQISQRLAATILINQSFTVRSLSAKLRSNSAQIVHLATHGQFGSTAQDTFIQAWDGKLNLNDLQAMLTQRNSENPIELLVLSACETAKGDKRAALGMAGVAVRSGARSTLATLWRVNDLSTAMLVKEFYAQFTSGKVSRSQALRQAQLNLLNQKKYDHPFYWASFVLVGNWQ
ncbi:CHAT domain-containing protein [Leptolyngbya sp. AN03gr2]|uniref:CHAT domain-containing protein n=1 Tax=unclassified Leptolyngbya TaxID=2650499 RepID=UPI003D31CE11